MKATPNSLKPTYSFKCKYLLLMYIPPITRIVKKIMEKINKCVLVMCC